MIILYLFDIYIFQKENNLLVTNTN